MDKKVKVAFRLSMPGNNSWNGKWSGDGKLYAVVRDMRSVKAEELASARSYGYNFGDGWFASVNVAIVSAEEAKRIKKQTLGFCGYEWMVNSIELHGVIKA